MKVLTMSNNTKSNPRSSIRIRDENKDGMINESDVEMKYDIIKIKNEDRKEIAQRKMAWFSLIGMLFYPFSIIIATVLELENAANIIGNIASTYFVSVAAIVAAFFAKEAYVKKNKEK